MSDERADLDLDDLDRDRADLEARFRALEQEAAIQRMRAAEGRGPVGPGSAADASTGPPRGANDDLADIKAALDGDTATGARFVLLLCPSCGARNRTDVTSLRDRLPICGGCKHDLSFGR